MEKDKMSGGGKYMDNAVGMCSHKKNPMSAASRVSRECGPGENADQQHANRLLQKAHKQKDSLRGLSGM